jgi:hypothetical protein
MAKKKGKKLQKMLVAQGADPGEVKIMADCTNPLLWAPWLRQIERDRQNGVMALAADRAGFTTDPAPLGMDEERLKVHREAKLLAADRCRRDPRLDPAQAYCLAAIEIADRDSGSVL